MISELSIEIGRNMDCGSYCGKAFRERVSTGKTKRNKYRGILFSIEHIFAPKLISNEMFGIEELRSSRFHEQLLS